MSKKLNLPVGISDFTTIRENGYYYVDKTGLIFDLVQQKGAQVTLITRPRRFGKTMGMYMLADFFDIRKDSKTLFDGLEVSKDTEFCDAWMNRHPTLFLTFKPVDGLHFTAAREMLRSQISNLCNQHLYLASDKNITENDRNIFQKLADFENGNPTDEMLKNSITMLIRMMQIHYQKSVILLLDEYDVPIAKASQNGYYQQMLDLIKGMMGTSLKDNPDLKFAVITGCLRIAKESIFTGTNNFVSDTIVDSHFNEYFGFTQGEVNQILKDAALTEHAEDMQAWYDGYHFGEYDVYCPWDVMNYLRDLQWNPKTKPKSYWKNTSDNAIIRSFIDYAGNSITKKLETLLSGGYITQRIDDSLTYDYLHSSEDNLWSILYLTGYLTQVREQNLHEPLADGFSALMIPNAEVRDIYQTTIMKWFDENAQTWDRKALFDAVWNGDSETMTQEMSKLLRRTISYHDYREDFYHAFLAGIFTGAGYMVESNKEHGEGRSDVIVHDPVNARIAIFEAKYAKSVKTLHDACDTAIQQIDNRMYAEEFEDDYDDILCYGIAFFKKRCVVKKK